MNIIPPGDEFRLEPIPPVNYIHTTDTGFWTENPGFRSLILWDEVVKITAEAVDCFTYDDLGIIFYCTDGTTGAIDERHRNFWEVMESLESRYPGLSWRQALQAINNNAFKLNNYLLWER